MIATEYTVRVKKFEPKDPRLGRHVRHDSRSLMFLAPASPRTALKSIKHTSNIPTLDQGQIGSCTGNASTKNLSYGDFWSSQGETVLSRTDAAADEAYAVGVYSAATGIDLWDGTYPPTDTGSDGLSVAKVLHGRNLISGYQHATSLDAVLTALQNAPVITGTSWNADMFEPDVDGRVRITGAVQGGHEYVLDEVDMENKRVWMQNSWGDGWGIRGRAWFTFDDYAALLANDGDATVFVPISEPAPTPTPIPVDNSTAADIELAGKANAWLAKAPFFYKRTVQKWLRDWIEKKHL